MNVWQKLHGAKNILSLIAWQTLYVCCMAPEKATGLISVRAQKELIEEGKRIAGKRGVSLSDLVRMLLIEEVERIKAQEKKDK